MVKPVIRMLCSVMSHMPLQTVWRDSGITQKHGFELIVDVTTVPNDQGQAWGFEDRAPRLLDGTYDFVSGIHHETYVYRARGDKRLVYLAQAQDDWDDRLMARPEIRTVADLEGKRVLSYPGACVLGNLQHSLQIAGVDLDKVHFKVFNQHPRSGREIVAAVVEGEADAANVDIPFDKVGEKYGLHRIEIPSLPVIHNTTICANRDWVRDNEETTLAFLRSMVEAVHFFKTEKDKACAIMERSLAPLIGLEGSDEVEHLHAAWSQLLSAKPYPHPLAVWNVYNLDVAHDPKVNFIGPFEIWDTSYLRTIDDEGFIDKLYGSAEKAMNPHVNAAI